MKSQKGFARLTILLSVLVVVVIAAGGSAILLGRNTHSEVVACTQEAKLCPDGSSVGRTGPNCEFAACPEIQTANIPAENASASATINKNTLHWLLNDPTAESAVGHWVLSGTVSGTKTLCIEMGPHTGTNPAQYADLIDDCNTYKSTNLTVNDGYWSEDLTVQIQREILTSGSYLVNVFALNADKTLTSLATSTLVIEDYKSNATVSVSGMNKYTDKDFGFSFWYPSNWNVTSVAIPDVTSFPGGTIVKLYQVGPAGNVTIAEVHSTTMSITDTGGAGPFGPVKYYFDPTAHTWMKYGQPEGSPSERINVTAPADVSINTMGGLHMFSGTSRFDATIIPLSAQDFLVISDGGATNATYLARTVIATDPSVATPDSTAQQTAIIQAEKLYAAK